MINEFLNKKKILMAILKNIKLNRLDVIFSNKKLLTTLKYIFLLLNQQLIKFFLQLFLINIFIFTNTILLQLFSTYNFRKNLY